MNHLERQAERQRARLLDLDASHHTDLLRAYTRVTRRVTRDLARLTRDIQTRRDQGQPITTWWLYQQARYATLLAQLQAELERFSTDALGVAVTAQADLAQLARPDAQDLIAAALGPGDRRTRAWLAASFHRLPAPQIERLVGNTATGTPLNLLFRDLAPSGVDEVRDALVTGVATGQPARVIAREVADAVEVPALRAMTIVRTESLRVYRQVTRDTYTASEAVTEWVWLATRSERTCPVCLAMHGTRHPLDEPFASHPNCRCTMIPRTRSWAELGFDGIPDDQPQVETGADLLRQMTEGERLAVLGRRRLAAYNAGRIALQDLVRPTQSVRWGRGLRAASLRELGV